MSIKLKPETERLVQEEVRSGHFHSADEVIVASIQAWREKHRARVSNPEQCRGAVERALAFAKNRAIPLGGVSIRDLIHEGHRL